MGFCKSAIGHKMLYMPPPLDWTHANLQYRCEKCGKKFERTETISEHEATKPTCPKCGSKKVSFVPGNVTW